MRTTDGGSMTNVLRAVRSKRGITWVILVAAFAITRVLYATIGGLRFDVQPLDFYLQYVDPELLRTALLESVYYLHGQPPLFNYVIGLVLQVFPGHEGVVLHAIYLCCGLVIMLGMHALMTRMRVPLAVSATTALLFAASPVTILFEHWLIYTYPIAALLVLSAVLVTRFAANHRTIDAVAFFGTLAVLAYTRGLFHPLWMILVTAACLWCWRRHWRRLSLAAAVPLLLVVALSVKNFVLFGTLSSGQVYLDLNLGMMTINRIPYDERRTLVAEESLSPIVLVPVYGSTVMSYRHLLEPYEPAGVAVLDQVTKSNGQANLHHGQYIEIARMYGTDARVLLAESPGLYLRSLWRNVKFSLKPAHAIAPFGSPGYRNAQNIRPLLRGHDRIMLVDRSLKSWVLVVMLPLLILFAAALTTRWLVVRRRAVAGGEIIPADAAGAPAAYLLFTILYLTVLTIALSVGDHNRYRFMLAPFYAVLFARLIGVPIRMVMTRAGADTDSDADAPTASSAPSSSGS
ncbi:MAG: hypothetical protein GY715_01740 [Planctomycetes bacterium]|nr:hypothetical protein [Planctomycetota bacterium]